MKDHKTGTKIAIKFLRDYHEFGSRGLPSLILAYIPVYVSIRDLYIGVIISIYYCPLKQKNSEFH